VCDCPDQSANAAPWVEDALGPMPNPRFVSEVFLSTSFSPSGFSFYPNDMTAGQTVEPGALYMRPAQHYNCQLERQRLGSPAGKIATVVILLSWALQIFAFHKPALINHFNLVPAKV